MDNCLCAAHIFWPQPLRGVILHSVVSRFFKLIQSNNKQSRTLQMIMNGLQNS